jgi:DcmR-like sensory protein
MSSPANLLDHPDPEDHIVQLYGTDDRLLTRNVARYLAEGLRRGDGLLVIATREHNQAVTQQLREEPSYAKAVLEGRLVFLDAQATLARLMVADRVDGDLFETVVGEAVRSVQERAGHTGVRAYGEMVGLLWKSGQFSAAVRLEEHWNALLDSSDVSLFCAYPIDVFSEAFTTETVDSVLCAHTHMLPIDQALESALNRAMDEVLGPRMHSLRGLIKANHRPSWGVVPRSEAIVLWLRNNLPGSAGEILDLARRYYQPLSSTRVELAESRSRQTSP